MDLFEKLPSLPKLPEIPDKIDLKMFQKLTATLLYIFFLGKLLVAFISSHIFNPMFPYGLSGGFARLLMTTLKVAPAALIEALSGLIGYNIFKREAEKEDEQSSSSNGFRGYLVAIVALDVACIVYKVSVFGAGRYAFIHIPFTSIITIIGAVALNLCEEGEPEVVYIKEIVVQPATPPVPEVEEPTQPTPGKINGMIKVFEAGSSDKK